MQQDELAQMFSRHMQLSQIPTPEPVPIHQDPEPEPQAKQIVYASQHYTHTYHVASSRSASEPPVKTYLNDTDLSAVLLRNSIDPSLLFPSQVDLFRNADDDQRLRLLELWRISPPQGRQGTDFNTSQQLYDWPPTSLAQEETMAKMRYERMQEERTQQQSIDQHQEQMNRSLAALSASPNAQNAEPYMTNGYELMAQREYEASSAQTSDTPLRETNKYNHATDPVYNTNNNNGLWQKNVGSISDMENNYGAFAYARENGFYQDDEMML